MNSFALLALFAVIAAANAGILAPSLYSAPLAYSAPFAYGAPALAGGVLAENSVVAGPSGTIVSGRTLGVPGLAAYGAPGVIAARTYLG